MAGSDERVAALDALLWTYDEASFLPHGTARDGNAARQPIWLTAADENPNAATMLVLIDGVASARIGTLQARLRHVRRQRRRGGRGGARALARRQGAGHALTIGSRPTGGWEKRGVRLMARSGPSL